MRKKLPARRGATTTSFSLGSATGYLTVGEYEDGTPGEIFTKVSKQGSTLAGIMDAFSISTSVALQYGVPLDVIVSKLLNMRFEPAGLTTDPDVRMAQSIVDYIGRRLALDYLPYATREALGVLTTAERTVIVDAEYSPETGTNHPTKTPATGEPTPHLTIDTPMCATCGTAAQMQRSGSCWAFRGCGSTTGCS
jgi:ribonucleoside-diphosphate reductase alpha chain